MVYEDAEKLYAEVKQDGLELIEEAFSVLFPRSISLASLVASKARLNGSVVGYNTTFFPRRDVVRVPLVGGASQLKSQVVQATKDGKFGYALMDCTNGSTISSSTGLFADCMPASGQCIRCFCAGYTFNVDFCL